MTGAFLVPYFLCWTLAAVPIFFLEVSVGQFLQRGGITVWKVCPIFKGPPRLPHQSGRGRAK